MSDDVLDEVLEYSKSHAEALGSRPDILHHILGCDICNSLMVDPYTLQCGHSFCGKCLESWTRSRSYPTTCPTCRVALNTLPVMSLALRQLALTVVDSWNKDSKHTNKVGDELVEKSELPQFFPDGALETPRYDSEDDVYRCPSCSHEIEEDGRCSGCSRYYPQRDVLEEDNEWQTDTDYDDNPRETRLRDILNISDSDDSDAADDLGSFVMHDEDEGGINLDSSDSSSFRSDLMNEEEPKEGDDADDTSDDSLLEETRRRTYRDDDDVEVVGVVGARHLMIDDDSD